MCRKNFDCFLFYNPRFGRSHTLYMGKLADLLAKNGHDVVNYQPVHTLEFNDTGTTIARTIVRDADYEIEFNFTKIGGQAWKGMSIVQMFRMNIGAMMERACRKQLNDTDMLERLRAEKFDFAFTEFMDLCGLLIFESIGVTKHSIVYASSLPMIFASVLGIPATNSFVPDVPMDARPPMTFMQRTQNLLMTQVFHVIFKPRFINPFIYLGQEQFGDSFDVTEKAAQSQLIFVNVDEFLDFPRPITHKVHYIGGIGMKKPEPLEPKYERFFDKQPCIYMSFGTVAPSETRQAFLEAFSRFPNITFLWKYERPEEKINANHSNVILEKWWPQTNLLGHKKLLAFITHGGMNSLSEASHAGVPLIVIPLFADQHRNARIAEYREFGFRLNALTLSADTIAEAIQNIVDNKNYKKKAAEHAQLMRSKPYNVEEQFVRYSEFAAKNDLHSRLDMSGRKLNLIQFYNLDVLAFVLFVTAFALFVVFILFKLAFRGVRKCCGSKKNKKE
ncbi:UDP-glucuronosyltransferase [Aphelenchoides bicaudatus]|nr:UDP-glucuronosyltransferase [Aphelenchoides bicaudatus]